MPHILYRHDTGEVVWKGPVPYAADLTDDYGQAEVGPDVVCGMIRNEDGSFRQPEIPVDLVAYAAVKRYECESSGIDVGGNQVATDRASQNLINGAFNLAVADSTATFQFKTADGFVSMDAAAIQLVAVEVGRHVQACFAKEADVLAAIESGEIDDPSAVDAAFASV